MCPTFDLIAAKFAVQLMQVIKEEGHSVFVRESCEESVVEAVIFNDELERNVAFRHIQDDGVLIPSRDML